MTITNIQTTEVSNYPPYSFWILPLTFSLLVILSEQRHVRPVVAADMALKCNAKKLILNHVSSQFLPIRATFHKYVNQDIRLDWELLDEVSLDT